MNQVKLVKDWIRIGSFLIDDVYKRIRATRDRGGLQQTRPNVARTYQGKLVTQRVGKKCNQRST